MGAIKFPSVNQMIMVAITLLVLSFVVKMLPANIQSLFRI